ncbi:MAG: hypothetical protein DRO15_05385, partial [Thermoprotei archaeon]
MMLNIFWFYSMCTNVLSTREYSGIIRSISFMNDLLYLLNSTLKNNEIRLYAITIRSIKERYPVSSIIKRHKFISDIIELSLREDQIVVRGLLKLAKVLRIISQRSPLNVLFTLCNPSEKFKNMLSKNRSKNIFVIDGVRGYTYVRKFFTKIRKFAHYAIYLSHDFGSEYYSSSLLTKKICEIEKELCSNVDLVIASSSRDALKYHEIYEVPLNKIVVYPNVYLP